MNFDRLARHYDWMEAVTAGSLLHRARTAWLDALADRRRILSVGEGHGRFAAACVGQLPEAHLTCVEASPRMLVRAQARVATVGPEAAARVRWIQDTLPRWRPEAGAYDAVVTCFFLDCFPPETLAEIISTLASGAKPDAAWLVVDFALPDRNRRLARVRATAIHAIMYAFFRVVTRLPARRLTPPDNLLREHGFVLRGRREWDWGLVRADLWERRPS